MLDPSTSHTYRIKNGVSESRLSLEMLVMNTDRHLQKKTDPGTQEQS